MDLLPEPPNSSSDNALLTRIYDDFLASQNWGLESKATAKDPATARLSGSEKMDGIFDSLYGIKKLVGLLGTTISFIASFDDSKLKPAVDSLSFTKSQLNNYTSCISKCADNTKEKKYAQQANTKLNKTQRRQENQDKFVMGRVMRDSPRDALLLELKSLVTATKKRPALSVVPDGSNSVLLPRLKAKSDADSPQIRIPRPRDGQLYTRQEAVDVYNQVVADIENENLDLGGMTKLSYLKQVKLLMIEKKYVPCQKSALDKLLRDHGAPGQPKPNPFWDAKGRPDKMDMDTLIQQHDKHQIQNPGKGWVKSDTRDAVHKAAKDTAAAKGIALETLSLPSEITIDRYHNTLLTVSGNKELTSKPKPDYRYVGEHSYRSTIANTVAMLHSRTYIAKPADVPKQLSFDESKATPGAIASREIVAKAYGVDPRNVFFTDRKTLCNIDDKASQFSKFRGDR